MDVVDSESGERKFVRARYDARKASTYLSSKDVEMGGIGVLGLDTSISLISLFFPMVKWDENLAWEFVSFFSGIRLWRMLLPLSFSFNMLIFHIFR